MNFKTTHKKVVDWGRERNILSQSTPLAQVEKLQEELDELRESLKINDMEEAIDAIGDMMVVLTMISELIHFPLDLCYNHAYNNIRVRTGKMKDGIFVKDA